MERITLILPCYNEAAGLGALAERLSQVLPGIAQSARVAFELVFIDDGSRDSTCAILQELCFAWPSRLLVLSRNFGKEAALTAGMDAATGDAVIFMDADLQHPPELIEPLIENWRQGHEVVYFYKSSRQGEGSGRRGGARLFYWLINFGTRFDISTNAGDFRLLDRKVVDSLRRLPERERFLKGLYAWVGYDQIGLPYEVAERHDGGPTRFTSARLFGLAIDGLTSFSVAPIRLISLFGFSVCALSFLYLIWIIGERLIVGSPFSGFATIVVLVVFFGGVQLVCLGIIGEYVGKALLEAKQRPTYIVKEQVELAGGLDKEEMDLSADLVRQQA
ncbi:glycosyltransferase family 2 protein [Alloyangia pacifica]|uniref:glycosyltransferase family 2 protein n=1 Tax=Alloyangia pacifica TaxID=311180 RepID=UPI001CFD5D95|nr:glycosyltransferase family 2 protein [Alloyangia pacifica]